MDDNSQQRPLNSGVKVQEERRRAYVEAGYWDETTLVSQLDHWAATTPEQIAVVDMTGQRRKTFRELQVDSCRVAALLSTSGVSSGDVVAVQLPNWYETVAIGLGVLRLGAVLNPLLPVYGAKELRLMLDVGRARVIVSPDEYRSTRYDERVKEAIQGAHRDVRHLTISDPNSTPDPLAAFCGDEPPVGTNWYANAGDVSELLFTSGTESLPKAILHSEQTTNFGIREMGKFLGLGPNDVVWMPMPVGHSTGFNYGVRLALFHGLKLVLQDRWDAKIGVQLCEAEEVTCTAVAPTFLLDMLDTLRERSVNLSRLRYFGCAGAPIPVGVVEAAARFGISVLRGYGSTETLAAAKSHPDFPLEKRAGTDGKVLPGVEVALRGEDGEPVPRGQEGEIFVRSPGCCLGFASVPGQASSNASTDGWVRTGDLAIIEAGDFITIIGRKKEIIIRGGMNVAPREIEGLLLKHPLIERASVIGLPDPRLGEVVCACVVMQPGTNLDFESVVNHLKELQVAPYKLPSRVEFLDSLPTTMTGKVKKPELVAWVLGRTASPSTANHGG